MLLMKAESQKPKSERIVKPKATKDDAELLSLHTIQVCNALNQKKTAYSMVYYLSNKRMTNSVSQIEAEVQLVP